MAVMLPDVRLTGELARRWNENTILWGRPEVGMALTDLRACIDSLAARGDFDTSRVALVGLEDASVSALYAGALEPRFKTVVACGVRKTYQEGRLYPLVSNILRLGDLPQIASAIAPRRLVIGRVTTDSRFDFTRGVYRLFGMDSKLGVSGEEISPAEAHDILKSALSVH
jgi:hypothetical protein